MIRLVKCLFAHFYPPTRILNNICYLNNKFARIIGTGENIFGLGMMDRQRRPRAREIINMCVVTSRENALRTLGWRSTWENYFLRAVERPGKYRKTWREDFYRPHLRDRCPRGQLYLRRRLKVMEGRRLLQVRVEVERF